MNNPRHKRHTGQNWNRSCSLLWLLPQAFEYDNCQHVALIASLPLANPKALQSQSLSSEQKSSTCRHGSFLNAEVGTDAGRNSKQMQDVNFVILWSYFVRFLNHFCVMPFFRTESRIGQDSLGIPTSGRVGSEYEVCSIRLKWWAPVDFSVVTFMSFVFWSVIFNIAGLIYVFLPTRCAMVMMIFGAGLLSSMSHIRGELGDMSTASIAAGVVADSAWLSVQPEASWSRASAPRTYEASWSRASAPRTLLRSLDFGPSMCWTDSLMLSRSHHLEYMNLRKPLVSWKRLHFAQFASSTKSWVRDWFWLRLCRKSSWVRRD